METEIDLNFNLKRIARERANQKRGITPKKEHDGYLVLISRQCTEYCDHSYEEVWKSIIQTPYDSSMPLATIRNLIEEDLSGDGILKDIGCLAVNSRENNGRFCRFDDDKNGCYKWNYQANYRRGFWEIEIFTTHSLVVPEYRRPQKKNSQRTKQREKT